MGMQVTIALCLCVLLPALNGETVQQAAVSGHNAARSHEALTEHAANIYQLVWDAGLARDAAAWAQGCRFEHSPNQGNKQGQNLYYQYPYSETDSYYMRQAITSWMDEKQLDSTGQFDCCYLNRECCHYTQVVSAQTRYVGCAVAHCNTLTRSGHVVAQDAAYVVCDYTPMGNLFVNGHHEAYATGRPCSQCRQGDGCDHGLCVHRA